MAYSPESHSEAFGYGASGMPGGRTYPMQTLQQSNVPPMFTGGGILAVQNQTRSPNGQSYGTYRYNNTNDLIRRDSALPYGGNPQYMNV